MVRNLTSTDPNQTALGDAIRQRRIELKLRPEDVASRADISIRTLYRVESGYDVTFKKLDRIAAALDLSLPELVAKRAS